MDKRIVLLCTECYSTTALYHYLQPEFPVQHIITEDPIRGMALAKSRLKRLGIRKVSGQIAFSLLIVPFLALAGRKRIKALQQQYAFDQSGLPREKITHFPTVNDEACGALLEKIDPDIVIVNGTRIISAKILKRCRAVFINMHAGITPQYRGVHGAYWALQQNDPARCGVTIHLVDKGIDTGGILYQAVIPFARNDNFVTYPYLQLGEGLPLLKKAVGDAAAGQLKPLLASKEKGKVWYHPGFWEFLYNRVFRGKK